MGEAPSKAWTKLLGGESADYAYSVSTASDGSIYIAGYTGGSIDGQSNNGSEDAFITKFNSDGSKVWTKLVGGGSVDYAQSVSTASDGSIYIAGYTEGSIDGQSNNGVMDAFITKFNSDGSKVWTKLLGGGSKDFAESVSTASDGSIYIAGYTTGSIDGQSNNGGEDAFITKLNSDGSKVWTKLVGGGSVDYAQSVSTASDGSIYIAGYTEGSIDGQSNNGSNDAFITKFNSDGSKVWTKLLGGGSNDIAYSVSTASDGSIYIAGKTDGSIDGQSNNGSNDAFITKFNSDGSKVWTRLLGGASYDSAQSVSTASDGYIYIAGYAGGSIDGQSNNGGYDAFITKLNSDGSKVWTKLLGGVTDDYAHSVSTASDGTIYIAGITDSSIDGQSNSGWNDAFITKLNSDGSSGNTKTYTLTPSAATINEGAVLTSTITTSNVATGTILYYALSGTGITTADFSAGALTGEGITDATGKFTFTHTLANDLTTEGAESLSIKLFSDTARTLQVGSTATVSIVDSSITAPLVVRGNSLYTIVDGPSWTQAEANSVKLGGHLTAITSTDENFFVGQAFTTFKSKSSNSPTFWIGATDAVSEGKWEWVNGEKFNYNNFGNGEPNNLMWDVNGQDYATTWIPSPGGGYWTDLSNNGIESDTGIAETPFIRRGDSAYVIVSGPTWEEAEANAVKLGGHLVTINDKEENEWLVSEYIDRYRSNFFIGLSDNKIEGAWKWTDGEKYGYSNWYTGEPSNSDGGEDYVVISGSPVDADRYGYWNDTKGLTPESGIAEIKLAPNNTPTGTPTVTGTFKVGSTLTIDATAIKDSDNFTGYTPTFNYNWETSTDGTTWSKLTTTDGADNNNTYILTAAESSKKIRGVVSYLDGYGTNEVVNSAAIDLEGLMSADPNKSWTRLLGTSAVDIAYSVTTGSDGSIYIAGITKGNLDGNSNAGNGDAFLSKYNNDGTKSWTRLLGTSAYDSAHSITTGSDGSIYIAGYTSGNLDGNSNAGVEDAFLSKYNRDGTKSWTRLLGSDGREYANSVTTGSDGSIYIAGYTIAGYSSGNLDGNRNAGKWGSGDAFLSKYNNDGTKSWTRLLGSSAGDIANSITTGSDGSIYFTGVTGGNLDGNDNAGSGDAFLSKYNSDGTKYWTRLLGSSAYDYATSVTTSSDESIYISGYTYGNLDGNSNAGNGDAFLSKYNSDGTKSWTRLLGSDREDLAKSVTTGSDGSIYIAGDTNGNLDGNSNNGINDAFLSKYNSDGTKSWTRLLGSDREDLAKSVTTGSDGSIYIAGDTEGNLDGNSNAGSADAFLSKFSFTPTYALTPSTTSINEGSALTTSVATTNILSGTTFYYSLSGAGITTADFSAGALTGEGTTDATGKFTFTHTLANDLTTEGAETLNIKLFTDSARTVQVGSTATVSVVDSSTTAPLVVRGNSLYTIVDGPSWTQAEANSVKLGGHLITFNNKEELFWVQDVILSDTKNPKVSYFTGLNDVKQEGSYEWSSGQKDDWNNVTDLIHRQNWIDQQQSIAPTHDYTAIGWGDRGFRGDYTQEYRPDLYNNKLGTIVWVDNTNSWAKTQYGQNTLGISETPFIRRGDSAYVNVSGPTWEEAEVNAVKLGGHLVTINDAAENDWIKQNLGIGKWIGINDKDSEGNFRWSSGEPVVFTDWGDGEPNNAEGRDGSTQHYGWIQTQNDYGKWDDAQNGVDIVLGIAEIKLSTPTPTYALTPSATTINEGATLTTSVATTNVATGTKFYYALSGTGITTADFSAGALTGEGITDDTGKFSFSHAIANDLTTEGAETLYIKLFTDSARTVQVGSTATVSIADTSLTQVAKDTTPPTIALTTNKASLTAGEQATITFTISEDSTDFTSSDITTSSGGTLSDFKGSGKIYTATFTPKANTTAASVVAVANKTFSDSASNFNNDEVEANNKVTFFIDTIVAPGVKITLPGDLTTDENGKSVVIPLVLKTEPKAAVRLDFILSKGAEASLSTKSFEFSTANWSTPQSLTIKGIDDYVDDVDQKYSLTITGSSTDKSYQTSTDLKGLNIPLINLINLDDGEDEGADIYGDPGAKPTKDTLNGTEGPDRIYGLLTDDILYGAAGKDLIFGGYGNDILYGEISDDELYGQDEDDTLYGGDGNDRLTGGEGFDKLIGGAGNDIYVIDDERDTIDDQGLGTDIDTVLFRANLTTYTMPASIKNAVLDSGSAFKLIGNGLDNNLKGNDNNNEIDGGDGSDVLNGGGGDDLLKGGSGSDTAHYHKQLPGFTFGADGGAGITANLLTGKASGTEIGNDTLVAIENIETSDGSDTLIGNENANMLIANGGNDLLEANGGNDNLIGGQGDDLLDGGEGNDQAVYSGVRDDYEVSQDSTGTKVFIKDKRQFQDGIDTITGIETVKFADKSLVLADLTSKTLDFNGDGNVDSFDSILMMRHMMGTYPGESIKKDIPGKFDLTAIQRKLTNAFADTFSLNGGLRLDIDGDKRISAFGDGMMITQHIHKQGKSDTPWMPPGFNPPAGFPAQMQKHLKDLIGF